jgi:tRNA threonylcarbamoyladenosine biosynthesis protein TsaE
MPARSRRIERVYVRTAAIGSPASAAETSRAKAPIEVGVANAALKRRSSTYSHSSTYTGRVEATTRNVLQETSTHSAEETIAFGRTLTELLAPPKLVLLRGDLGAGKTTLVKGIATAFEAAAEEDVTSPTFTLVHEYRGPRANLYHIDLYRVDTPRELETLGLDDLRSDNSILLIEWGEKFPRLQWDVEIALEREGENERRIRVRG